MQKKGMLTYTHTIRDGDTIVVDGTAALVLAVKRAQGRKPARGENLHLLTDDGLIKANSASPIRVLKRATT